MIGQHQRLIEINLRFTRFNHAITKLIMKSLYQIAEKYGTDKALSGHGYVEIYQKIFANKNIQSLLEIGMGQGASLRTWLDWLPSTEIYCMELFGEENKVKWGGLNGTVEGVIFINGSSTLQSSWNHAPENLDVIIDNGSHLPDDQLQTFLLGFPHLKSGGVWIIEDIHCSFETQYGYKGGVGKLLEWLYAMIFTQQFGGGNYGGNFRTYRERLDGHSKDISGFEIYKSLVAIHKI